MVAGRGGFVARGLRAAAEVLPRPQAGLLPGLAVGDVVAADSGGRARLPGGRADAPHGGVRREPGASSAARCWPCCGCCGPTRGSPRRSARPHRRVRRAGPAVAERGAGRGDGRRSCCSRWRSVAAGPHCPRWRRPCWSLLLRRPRARRSTRASRSRCSPPVRSCSSRPGGRRSLRRAWDAGMAAEALVVPTAAFLVTAPLVAGLNGEVNPFAVLANLLAVPAVAPATVLGVLAAVLSPLGLPLAEACAWLRGPGGRLAGAGGRPVGGRAGGGRSRGRTGSWARCCSGCWPWRCWRSAASPALTGAPGGRGARAGAGARAHPRRAARVAAAGWAVVACDVGQGDALVLATGRSGLGGARRRGSRGRAGRRLPRPARRARGSRWSCSPTCTPTTSVGWAVRCATGRWPGWRSGRPRAAVGAGRRRQRPPPRRAHRWSRSPPGSGSTWPGLTLEVLGPLHPAVVVDPEDGTGVNDGSLVLRAGTPAGSVLLTGDVELAAQADLVAAGADLRADVLKMPHHGSRYTSVSFLTAVAPRAVLVSVGRATATATPTRGSSAPWNGRARPFGAPTPTATWPSWRAAAGATVHRGWRSSPAAPQCHLAAAFRPDPAGAVGVETHLVRTGDGLLAVTDAPCTVRCTCGCGSRPRRARLTPTSTPREAGAYRRRGAGEERLTGRAVQPGRLIPRACRRTRPPGRGLRSPRASPPPLRGPRCPARTRPC